MDDSSRTSSQSPGLTSSGKPQPSGGRQRIISSCLTCRRRKVRCDHVHPICGACARGSHVCTYATDQPVGPTSTTSTTRVAKPTSSSNVAKSSRGTDVQARLERLEVLLQKAVAGQSAAQRTPEKHPLVTEKRDTEIDFSPTSRSQSSQGAGISSDNHDGTLLLDDGQSQFVSSLHYALLADEIQDIKALLGDRSVEEDHDTRSANNLVHLLSLGRSKTGINLMNFVPSSQEHQNALLDIYFSNVDPMMRITHKQSLLRKFSWYIQELHPIAFAIFYSAINSLPPQVCEQMFGGTKDDLLTQYELGVEISLARENYLTTSSLEVLQGFIIWLTCITKEEDMGRAWALLGVAIRIALNQGLHRDPSLFPSGSMDTVTVELRRRMWHQICHLEYRAAECKGQEPSLSDEDFTTMLPRNIEDEDLIEGASPGPESYDQKKFTNMGFALIRFTGMRSLRRIVQSTYRLERRMLESNMYGASGPDPVQELLKIYEQIKVMVDDMHEENHRRLLQYASPEVPFQRLCMGLASLLEWRCYLLFWLRMPRAYRDVVFSDEIRKSIFEKSVNCVETLNGASVDADAARFHWHIGGHAAFQAIMHVLSELRNPMFDSPDRQRALQSLEMSRLLKENNTTKAWSVVKGMIDKVLGEQYNRPQQPIPPPMPYAVNKTVEAQRPPLIDRIPPYAYSPTTKDVVDTDAQAMLQQQAAPPLQNDMLNPTFNWDDINIGNIVGDVQQDQAMPMPEFDWGFWGDPINFNDSTAITYPADTKIAYAPF
ncbi:hypothetical protein BU24DRAFT_351626 [Aaosphaeria arxii CBS 175.79]|uniref:Zn(2)-C6 fungal-type domain-containing protein n=1 Tax=Aaosphaeria arxii CBS 175.79 TaxID=1450172 RepID=A0A6A5XI53_9PLEO|nr:uncharacterized protein BU24DRAFT_351626 [Aaosphaeria arxii CBS 175.79]KAF2012527.1 hypothetical protein BU24DRAFT_351626 [Aaosphaeria arxii CBS 175.79]